MNNNQNNNGDIIQSELYFVIAHYLNHSPFEDIAKELIKKLEEKKVLPKRYDWKGNAHSSTYKEIEERSKHISPNFLLQTFDQIRYLLDDKLNNNISNFNSILSHGQYSIIQDLRTDKKQPKVPDNIPKCLYSKYQTSSVNIVNNWFKQELKSNIPNTDLLLQQPELFKSSQIHKRILGHLAAVYCVCFDRTGNYVFTGADDNLIKVWNVSDGRLLATFRGHEKEISDIDVNYENTILASGSCDKTIRIWNLRSTESTTVLHGHSAMVSSVEFSPNCRTENRWLASSGYDGVVCFWQWNANTLTFNPKPKKFIEKSRSGAQISCIAFSTGGSCLAAGSNDHVIRVYYFENDSPIKICELESHSNIVDSIQYSNTSTRFLSGSKDGTARIWRYECKQWKALLIDATKTLHKSDNDELARFDIIKKYSVTMVTWNSDDSLVVTAQTNNLIKVWNSNDGKLIHELKGHTNEIFVLEAHPKDPRLLLSAGYDGFVILWNLLTGKLIKKFFNKIENEGHGCLLDAKWSPVHDKFAATDLNGNLILFGFGGDECYKRVPSEQFFHTDYRPLMRDTNDYVVDEQTQLPPHLMQPPFLVNAEGNPYSIELQRLVPGREHSTDAQLNPHVIINDRGQAEIIGDLETQEDNQQQLTPEERMQNRRRNLWKKDLIRPLGEELLKTSEMFRVNKLDREDEYIYREYNKEMNSCLSNSNSNSNNHHISIDDDDNSNNPHSQNSSAHKRGRGRGKLKYNGNSGGDTQPSSEIVCKNRLTAKALYDTDDEQNERAANGDDSDSSDGQFEDYFIDVDDDDSRQQQQQQQLAVKRSNRNGQSQQSIQELVVSSSDDSDSSEYSDWAEEEGRKTLKPPPTRAVTRNERKTRRNRVRIKDEEDEDLEVDIEVACEEETLKMTRKIRKARNLIDDDDDNEAKPVQPSTSTASIKYENKDLYDDCVEPKEVKPSTSQQADQPSTSSTSPKKQQQQNGTPKSQRKKRGGRSKMVKFDPSELKECPPAYRPPEWLTSTKPRKSPYWPQIGDEVVYFRQGHELYVVEVKASNAYELDETSLPWIRNHSPPIDVVEFCKVVGLKIEIGPPRLVCLNLNIIDKNTNKSTGSKFSIKYHDMPGVVDFVILKQMYDRALERNWKPKDRFRCIIDDAWWFGTIESQKPYDENYPESPFMCENVVWDSGETEQCSPWDLEPIQTANGNKKSKSIVKTESASIPVSPDEIKSLLYIPDAEEWRDCGRDAECDRILNGLEKIRELAIAENFNQPVDLDQFPDYATTIKYPIDLNTIKERLENRYYRRINSIQWDVRKIETNAAEYNQPKSEIVKQATFITELLLEFINDPNCTNPIPIYKRMSKSRVTENKLDEAIIMESSDGEQDVIGNGKSSNNDNNETTSKYTKTRNRKQFQRDIWKDDCKRLVEAAMQHQDSEPFRTPVDLNEFTDYAEVVSDPMDFGTIRSKLDRDLYRTLEDFDEDCRLVFRNSKAYNTNKRSKIYTMTCRLSAWYESKIREVMNDFKSAMKFNSLTTSRYGRKIKLRTNEPLYETFGSNAEFESDDARHGFDDNYSKLNGNGSNGATSSHQQATNNNNNNHNNNNNNSNSKTFVNKSTAIGTTSTHADTASVSAATSTAAAAASASSTITTRSTTTRRLRSSQSTTFNTQQNNSNGLKRSMTSLPRSCYTRDVSDTDDNNEEDDDNDSIYEDSNNSAAAKRNKQTAANNNNKKSNSHNGYTTSLFNGNGAASSSSAHFTRSSSSHNNNNNNNSNNHNNVTNGYNDDTENEISDEVSESESDEEGFEEELVKANDIDDPEYSIDRLIPKSNSLAKTKSTTTNGNGNTNTSSKHNPSYTTRMRTSKRNRKQFSYKEMSSSSNESDSCLSKKSNNRASIPTNGATTTNNNNNNSSRNSRKKQRRNSSSVERNSNVDSNNSNNAFDFENTSNSNSNCQTTTTTANNSQQKVSKRGRLLKTVTQNDIIRY